MRRLRKRGFMDTESEFNNNNLTEDELNIKREKKILNLSVIGCIVFLVAEIVCAIATHSLAILMDCIYDMADLVMVGPFLLLVPLLYKPTTTTRPYGFSQVESLFILIKYLVLLGVEVVLIWQSVMKIIQGGNDVSSHTIAIFEVAVSAGCVFMYLFLRRYEKKFTSPGIKAELFIWRLDSMSTLGVGLGFLINIGIGKTALAWICPYVDPAIAIIIAVALAKEPISMVIESVRNLILFAPDQEVMDKINAISKEKCDIFDTKITYIDVIKTGRKYWVEVYFETDRETIDVAKLKTLDAELEKALIEELEDAWLEMIPDVEEFRDIAPAKLPSRRQERIAYVEGQEKKKSEKLQKKHQNEGREIKL